MSSSKRDLWPAGEEHAKGPDHIRRSRLVVACARVICVMGLLAGATHAALGNPTRAMVPLAAIPAAFIARWILRRSGSVEIAVHFLCLCGMGVLVGSPLMAETETPLMTGLILIPFAACVMGGIRAGLIWTALATCFLIGWAIWIPFEGEERSIAWLSVISTAAIGIGVLSVERSREVSMNRMKEAVRETRLQSEERIKAQVELNRTRALFESSFEHAPSILIVASLEDGKILDVNASFVKTSGWTQEEAVGKSLEELNAWAGERDRTRLFEQAMSNGEINAVEIPLRVKSGELVWLLAGARILQVEGRGYLLAQGIDISERKRTERQLALYRQRLEEGFEERGEKLRLSLARLEQQERLSSVGTLAAGIAHQINNPIGGIVAAAQFALESREEPDCEEVREDALSTIVQEAMRCGRIVKNMLKFARNEETAKWRTDLNPIIQNAAESVRGYVDQRGGILEVGLATEPLAVHASPIDLEQVVVNLIRNATESRPAGVNVSVKLARAGGLALLEISDDGAGFSQDTHRRAFDPFFTSRTSEGGSGLGLSVVHSIVKDHGGQIDIGEVTDGGATIRVGLPLVELD